MGYDQFNACIKRTRQETKTRKGSLAATLSAVKT